MGDLSMYGGGPGLKVPAISPLDDLESEEEDREEEIKELLANALNNESFEEESDVSFVDRDEVSFRSSTSRTSLPHRRSSGRVNGNGTILTRDRVGTLTQNGGGDSHGHIREKGGEEMEARNETVSVLHQTRCPQTGNGLWLGSGSGDEEEREQTKEQVQALCALRERQVIRAEETIEGLSKDKRALNHAIGVMRTEMIHVKSAEEETQKLLRLKEEEVVFVKGQLAQVLEELELTRRMEREAKDRNNQLNANVGKLQQEKEMLSAIGSSAQQAELDDVVRQIREKHAKDIVSWKRVVNELEAQIRAFQRVDGRAGSGQQRVAETQTERRVMAVSGTQTDAPFESEEERDARWLAKTDELGAMYQAELQLWKQKLEEMPEQLFAIWQKNALLSKPLMRDCTTNTEPLTVEERTVVPVVPCPSAPVVPRNVQLKVTTETQTSPEREPFASGIGLGASIRLSELSVSSVESQTDETLETYRLLAKLIEQWVAEVEESTKRAEGAERRVGQAQQEIRKLRRTMGQLLNLLSTARHEWRGRERELERRGAETKAHYFRLLGALRDQVAVLQAQAETPGST